VPAHAILLYEAKDANLRTARRRADLRSLGQWYWSLLGAVRPNGQVDGVQEEVTPSRNQQICERN